jgi:hypothetical protein
MRCDCARLQEAPERAAIRLLILTDTAGPRHRETQGRRGGCIAAAASVLAQERARSCQGAVASAVEVKTGKTEARATRNGHATVARSPTGTTGAGCGSTCNGFDRCDSIVAQLPHQ